MKKIAEGRGFLAGKLLRKILRGGFSLTKPRDIQTVAARKFLPETDKACRTA